MDGGDSPKDQNVMFGMEDFDSLRDLKKVVVDGGDSQRNLNGTTKAAVAEVYRKVAGMGNDEENHRDTDGKKVDMDLKGEVGTLDMEVSDKDMHIGSGRDTKVKNHNSPFNIKHLQETNSSIAKTGFICE